MIAKLQSLLSLEKPPTEVMAIDEASAKGGKPLLWQTFIAEVSKRAAVLKARPESVWALYFENSIDFSIHLFAVWLAGGRVLIVGDNLPMTLANVEQDVDGFLGDFPNSSFEELGGGTSKAVLARRSQCWDQEQSWSGALHIDVDPEAEVATVFTTGTTGAPSKIPLCFRQLQSELEILEGLFGATMQDGMVFSTASHQHLYGLLFRLLWPIASGRVFQATNIRYMEELQGLALLCERYTLVTTPSHLSRLPETMNWPQLAEKIDTIFSSTAPLSVVASKDASEKFSCPVTEIYGSSETGGIAWRRQAEQESWNLFPGLDIEISDSNQSLRLRSPLSFSADWQETADRIERLSERRFKLLGRLDRIAKVEGKRVSLTAMEKSLLEHRWVSEAKLLFLQAKRTELAAVAVLNESGEEALASKGKRAVNVEIRKHLQQQFELPVLPRKWRYVDRVPVNSQGKTSEQLLQSLFAK